MTLPDPPLDSENFQDTIPLVVPREQLPITLFEQVVLSIRENSFVAGTALPRRGDRLL